MTPRRQTAVFLIVLAGMLTVAIALQMIRDRAFAHEADDRQVLYVSSPEVMRRVALSYDVLAADVYWIRALQHYGGERQKPANVRRFDLLYPLLDLATTLDPRFNIAYRFGAIFLAEPRPGGAGRPDRAIELLQKGLTFFPDKWDYYHDIGFIYYWHLGDYRQAAEWFTRGGNLPGAPFWLKSYAGVMLTRGGDRQASRALWMQIGQNPESDWLRRMAELRLTQLDALDQIDVLTRMVDDFTKRTGQRAQTWEQLARAGAVGGVPVDPRGTPYRLDSATGEIGVARESELWPLPTEPAAAPELKRMAPPVPR
jgi:tetratricopeptide (TPR) repeat protein